MKSVANVFLLGALISPMAFADLSGIDQIISPIMSFDASDSSVVIPQRVHSPQMKGMDCHYIIPATVTEIDKTLVSSWAKQAVIQMFTLDPSRVEKQLNKLQACFTDNGWASFNAALNQSQNIMTIKAAELKSSCDIDGDVGMEVLGSNQWKVEFPIQVLYKNATQNIIQYNHVTLFIMRKTSGELGINQVVVAPKVMPKMSESDTINADDATADDDDDED